MENIAPGPAFVSNYVLFLAVRQLLIYLVWILAAALAGAAACWCCGYGAQAAWARAEAARRTWRDARRGANQAVDDVSTEAERGIREIEEYLAVRSVILPRPQSVDSLEEEEPG